jgi:hypothetical protein
VNVTFWPFSVNVIVMEFPSRVPEREPELAQGLPFRASEAEIVDPFCAKVPTAEL